MLITSKIKPRNIASSTKRWLTEKIRKYKNKKITISSSLGDSEAALYAHQIEEIFKNAGWEVDGSGIALRAGVSGFGTFIFVKDRENIAAIFLQQLFKEKDIELQGQIFGNNELEIFVGAKSNDVDNHN